MPLAPAPCDQRTQQCLDVDPIGLNATPAPADLKTAGVYQKALNAPRLKAPRPRERVIAYFVAERDHRQRTARLRPTIPGLGELRHQLFCVPACDRIKARLLPIRKLDRQQPGLLAQLQRALENIRGSGRGGCLVHLSISFVASY